MPEAVSPALERLVRDQLASIEQIDVVLLLRTDRDRSWTAPEVARELGTPQESTAMRLFLLASKGVVVFEGRGVPAYRYAGTADEALMEELARLRKEQPGALTAITEQPAADPIRSFADAFKVKSK